jgi:hypothetical protein
MHRLAMLLVAMIALASGTEFAAARDGCGRGFFWDGYRCAPMARYDAAPGYGYRAPGYGYYPPGYPSPACYNYYGRRICCPGGYTVQDGVCRPYRGY